MQAASKGAGLRQLKQILGRIVKMDLWLRVQIWKAQLKEADVAHYRELQEVIEEQAIAMQAMLKATQEELEVVYSQGQGQLGGAQQRIQAEPVLFLNLV